MLFTVLRWRSEAACGQLPKDLFFPPGNSDVTRADEERAKEVCAVCPVRSQCLEFALENDERFGVWGGTTPNERRALVARERA